MGRGSGVGGSQSIRLAERRELAEQLPIHVRSACEAQAFCSSSARDRWNRIKRNAPGSGYLDAKTFTRLFEKNANNANRRLIAQGIYLIAQAFVRQYHWYPREWREDAAAEAALLGIRKIWHYQTRCKHTNAFAYFTRLIQMKVWEQLKAERWRSQGLPPFGWK